MPRKPAARTPRLKPEATPDAILAGRPPEVIDLAERLRALLAHDFPTLEERVNVGWLGFGYHAPGAGYVFGLFPKDDCVEVGFEHGAELEDPSGLFSRGGKRMRFVRLERWEPARIAALLDLTARAIDARTRH